MGRAVTIDGLTVKNGKDTPKDSMSISLFAHCDGSRPENPYPYVLPETVTYKNISIESGAECKISPNPENFKSVRIIRG
jgi:hypothetical protein